MNLVSSRWLSAHHSVRRYPTIAGRCYSMTVQDQVVTAAKPVTLVSFGKAHVLPYTQSCAHPSPHHHQLAWVLSGVQNIDCAAGTTPPVRTAQPHPCRTTVRTPTVLHLRCGWNADPLHRQRGEQAAQGVLHCWIQGGVWLGHKHRCCGTSWIYRPTHCAQGSGTPWHTQRAGGLSVAHPAGMHAMSG